MAVAPAPDLADSCLEATRVRSVGAARGVEVARLTMRLIAPDLKGARDGLRLRELTTPALDRVVTEIHVSVGHATARTCRSIISGCLGLGSPAGRTANPPDPGHRAARREAIQGAPGPDTEEQAAGFLGLAEDSIAQRQDLVDFSAFLLATRVRIGEAHAVTWSKVSLDRGLLTVTSTLIRVTGRGLVRKSTKSRAGQRQLLLPKWCVLMLERRVALGVGQHEPIFATLDGGFRDPRT